MSGFVDYFRFILGWWSADAVQPEQFVCGVAQTVSISSTGQIVTIGGKCDTLQIAANAALDVSGVSGVSDVVSIGWTPEKAC